MINLILDCSHGMSIILKTENGLYSKIDENQKKHTDELLVSLDELLKSANIKINQIDNLCVCVGPGSFTGIRVAISIAKGLAVVNNFKIWTLSNFDCYQTNNEKNHLLILEGFSDFVYVRKCENGKFADSCEKVSEVKQMIEKGNFEIYVQNEKVQKMLNLDEKQCQIAKNETNFAFLSLIESGKDIKLEQISPIYLRAAQAEIEREKKLLEKTNV